MSVGECGQAAACRLWRICHCSADAFAFDKHVRLLTVPASHLHVFWLEDEELKSRLMVIETTGHGPEPIQGESEFLKGLSLAVAPAGVLLAGNRVLTRA